MMVIFNKNLQDVSASAASSLSCQRLALDADHLRTSGSAQDQIGTRLGLNDPSCRFSGSRGFRFTFQKSIQDRKAMAAVGQSALGFRWLCYWKTVCGNNWV